MWRQRHFFEAQKSQHLQQLDAMQLADQLPVNNNYPSPSHGYGEPQHWQANAWQQPAYRGSLPDPIEEPAPDYSDDENEQPKSKHHHFNGQTFRINGRAPGGSLSADDWKNIVESAETHPDFPSPPPMARTPEPDYQSSYESRPLAGSAENLPQIIRPHPQSSFREAPSDSHVIAHKLRNPCLDSKERMAVHQELLMNKKMGIDVLNRKSELRRALDKRAEERRKKDHEEYLKSRKTVFEKRLEVQANKYKEYEQAQNKGKSSNESKSHDDKDQPEFLRIHSKIYKGKTS